MIFNPIDACNAESIMQGCRTNLSFVFSIAVGNESFANNLPCPKYTVSTPRCTGR